MRKYELSSAELLCRIAHGAFGGADLSGNSAGYQMGGSNWWFGAKAVQTPMTPRRFPPPWRADSVVDRLAAAPLRWDGFH
jgi:hypothetical protein